MALRFMQISMDCWMGSGYMALRFMQISMDCWMGSGYTTMLPDEVFTQRNFVGDCHRLKLN